MTHTYTTSIAKLLSTWMSPFQVWFNTLLKFYNKKMLKYNIKSANKILFYDILPLVQVYLKPGKLTPVMQELENFMLQFESCTEEQQLIIMSQMSINNLSIVEEPYEICHVHYCIRASNFLRFWNMELQEIETYWSTQYRYQHHMYRIQSLLLQIDDINKKGDLMILLVQTQAKFQARLQKKLPSFV